MNKPKFPIIGYCDPNDPDSKFEVIEADFTCSRCPAVATCEYAWDMYSINGDCIAGK